MNKPPVDDRSPIAKAIEQGSTVTTIALMMVVPALPGYWLDSYLKTVPLFTSIGLVLGMTTGIWQLIKFVNRNENLKTPKPSASLESESEKDSDNN